MNQFKIGEKIVHSKKPEWGTGEILSESKSGLYVILFSSGGKRTLKADTPFIQKFDQKLHRPTTASGKVLQPRIISAIPRLNPDPATPDLKTYAYSENSFSLFRQGELVPQWRKEFPQLFDEDDEAYIIQANAYSEKNFVDWLAAITHFQETKNHALLRGYLVRSQTTKQHKISEALKIMKHQVLIDLAKKYSSKAFPSHFVINPENQAWYFLNVLTQGQEMNPEQKILFPILESELNSTIKSIMMIKE